MLKFKDPVTGAILTTVTEEDAKRLEEQGYQKIVAPKPVKKAKAEDK